MPNALRILLAEDNEVNQHLMMRILARAGYEVTLAQNGIQVLNMMDKQDFDVILMDIQMPKMDGITATKLIRGHYATEKQPRIIALTAEVPTEGQEKYFKAGMNGMLTKPIQIDDLEKMLTGLSAGAPKVDDEVPTQKQSSSLNEYQSLDLQVINDFKELMGEEGQQAVSQLIDLYKKGTPELIDKIEEAYFRKDLDGLLRLVHTIKGSSSQVGARKMEQLCLRLEVLLKQSGIEPFGTFIPGIKQEYFVLEKLLDELKANLQ